MPLRRFLFHIARYLFEFVLNPAVHFLPPIQLPYSVTFVLA